MLQLASALGTRFQVCLLLQRPAWLFQQIQPLPFQDVGKASFLLRALQATHQVAQASCWAMLPTTAAPLISDTVLLLCCSHRRGELVFFYTAGIFPWFPLNLYELLCHIVQLCMLIGFLCMLVIRVFKNFKHVFHLIICAHSFLQSLTWIVYVYSLFLFFFCLISYQEVITL